AAIGGRYRNGKPGYLRHDPICTGTHIRRPGFPRHHDRWRVDLVGAQQVLWRTAQCRGHAGAILGHAFLGVARADVGVEARINALRNAALAREKSVFDASKVRERFGLEHHGRPRSRDNRSYSGVAHERPPVNPGSTVTFGSESASALNIWPMPESPS